MKAGEMADNLRGVSEDHSIIPGVSSSTALPSVDQGLRYCPKA